MGGHERPGMSKRVLLPVDLCDASPLPGTLTQAFSGTEVVLLGWFGDGVPETGSERGRTCRAFLHEQAAALLRAGAEVDVEVTETDDRRELYARIADYDGVDAVYVPGPITTLGRLLVALRDERTAEEVLDLLSAMNLEGVLHLTLFHVADDETRRAEATEMLDDVAGRVRESGVPEPSVETEVVVGDDPAFEIAQAAADHDAVLMGETREESIEIEVFGPVYERVRAEAAEPVVLVRRS